MDEKLSLEAITLYAEAYAARIQNDFFARNEKITGPEILSLCNIQQINLFVIREIFKAWKEETRKLKSIYFDNENAEVKEALSTYRSVLSNHISVDRTHFSPLLTRAVSDTLMGIFNPYDFFSVMIARNDKLEIAVFREEIKYLKINKAPLERMLKKLEERGVSEIAGNEALAILDQILEEVNFTPEDVDPYISSFSAVVPLDAASFYVSGSDPERSNIAPAQPSPSPVADEPVRVISETSITVEEKTVIQSSGVSTIHERFNQVKQPALADSLRKISRIKDSLTINQKFMFTKVLFYGDFESFSRAVEELDQLADMNAALQYLQQHSSAWDRESKEFHEFMEMVEKRFA